MKGDGAHDAPARRAAAFRGARDAPRRRSAGRARRLGSVRGAGGRAVAALRPGVRAGDRRHRDRSRGAGGDRPRGRRRPAGARRAAGEPADQAGGAGGQQPHRRARARSGPRGTAQLLRAPAQPGGVAAVPVAPAPLAGAGRHRAGGRRGRPAAAGARGAVDAARRRSGGGRRVDRRRHGAAPPGDPGRRLVRAGPERGPRRKVPGPRRAVSPPGRDRAHASDAAAGARLAAAAPVGGRGGRARSGAVHRRVAGDHLPGVAPGGSAR